MSVFLRVFGATICDQCESLRSDLDALKVSYRFVDAYADDQQDFCDKHDVDEIPHVQIVRDDEVLYEAVSKNIDIADVVSNLRAFQIT